MISRIPAFWDKTINLISRHLNLFTTIHKAVTTSTSQLFGTDLQNSTSLSLYRKKPSVTNRPKKVDEVVKPIH